MSDWLIEATHLTKRYRLYTRPRYRFMDIFGLLHHNRGAYTEHTALDDVSLQIARGKKVGFIGRNGAGKSTFLKLITGVIKPTSGQLTVRGATTALLQIGTGFHPDFTGRENVLAYLAHLGITGKAARARLAEIIEFTELEEYIDQPLKTYSTGMGARLMFATSTAVAPEVLVLDEVLGVGDAYFAHKSFERMQQMCSGEGTTVLLVSHDIYSVARICERVIWLDRGRVIMDSDALTVVKAYEDSIREQEENRLRLRSQARLRELTLSRGVATGQLTVEICSRQNRPQPCVVYFSDVNLRYQGKVLARLPLAEPATDDSHLQTDFGCWGEPVRWMGRPTRRMNNFGSPFHKVAGAFVFEPVNHVSMDELEVELAYYSELECDLVLRAFDNSRAYDLGRLPPASGAWASHTVRLGSGTRTGTASAALQPEVNQSGIHGTGVIDVTALHAIDEDGREVYLLRHGRPLTLRIAYEIRRPDLDERAQVLVAFQKDGTTDVCRCLTRDLHFRACDGRTGVVEMHLPALPLANGRYAVSMMIAEEGYYDRQQTIFFSINAGAYVCLSRALEFEVVDAGPYAAGTMVIAAAQWSLRTETASLRAAG